MACKPHGTPIHLAQAAHVGVGISGEEGLQAVNASDYSIAQVRIVAFAVGSTKILEVSLSETASSRTRPLVVCQEREHVSMHFHILA